MKSKIIHSGFTLFELLIYMGVSAIILASLTQIFVLISRLRLESQSFSSIQQDGAYFLSRFSYDLARSNTITIPALGQQGNILQTNQIRYSLDSNNHLQITDSLGTAVLSNFDTSISNLNFYHLGGGGHDNVRISFTLTSQVKELSGPQTLQFVTTVGTK